VLESRGATLFSFNTAACLFQEFSELSVRYSYRGTEPMVLQDSTVDGLVDGSFGDIQAFGDLFDRHHL
jgi:hypothetical protein